MVSAEPNGNPSRGWVGVVLVIVVFASGALAVSQSVETLDEPLPQSDRDYVRYFVRRPGLDGAPTVISSYFYSSAIYYPKIMAFNRLSDDKNVALGDTLRIPIEPETVLEDQRRVRKESLE